MKKALLPPFAVLTVLLASSLWNSRVMSVQTDHWHAQLQQAQAAAAAENWPDAAAILSDSYTDWYAHQVYLHIVSRHDAVDDAEAMYKRAMAFAAAQEPSEFQAELAGLRSQLHLLSEMERFSIQNIL